MFRKFRGAAAVSSVAATSFCFNSRAFASAAPDIGGEYDLIVIGGGSGGIACAKRSAGYGAKVAIVENKQFGGTCVNVGCVPKKMMYNSAFVAEVMHDAPQFGFVMPEKKPQFDWTAMKEYRDRYIGRLNAIYENGLNSSGVTRLTGTASFQDKNTILVGSTPYRAKHILVAVGGAPNLLDVPGDDLAIDSDGFFALKSQPKKVAVIGAGYIAVELAGVFNAHGTDTSLFVRHNNALRNFDEMISTHLDKSMKQSGIDVVSKAIIDRISKDKNGKLTVHLKDGRAVDGFDVVLRATGRHPLTAPLSLERAGVKVSPSGHILVDEYQNTSTKNVYALGDVVGNIELTPMAIAAGRRLADRLFGNMPSAKADYTNVPTVVFSHPVIGTIGYTEAEAKQKFGAENLKIYNSTFVNLWYGSFYKGGAGDKPFTKYKLICEGKNERVVGLHCIGMASDEVIQGFGVAMKMGATKADFDNCVAIHPTAAEELVTMPPWGMAPSGKN